MRHYPDPGSASDWMKQIINQSGVLPISGHWHVISMEFLRSFLRLHFAGKPAVASRNVGSSLRLKFLLLKFRISLVFWATELDTSLSSSICQPASVCRYRARGLSLFRGDKVKMVIELDDLSSSMTYRARWPIELGDLSRLLTKGIIT